MDFSGQDGPMLKGTKVGRVYLTTHRVIFNTKSPKDSLQSFSSPFISMSDVELEQPVFGANYIRGKIRAQPNGNWTGETKFKMSFKSGGCIDFGQALLRAASMAQRNSGGMASSSFDLSAEMFLKTCENLSGSSTLHSTNKRLVCCASTSLHSWTGQLRMVASELHIRCSSS